VTGRPNITEADRLFTRVNSCARHPHLFVISHIGQKVSGREFCGLGMPQKMYRPLINLSEVIIYQKIAKNTLI